MKEVFLFIKWKWSKWETWQKWWIVAMFFLGAGIPLEGQARWAVWTFPFFVFFFYTFKWWFWDTVKSSWNDYKKEKSELFDTIKNSDVK